MGVGDVHRLELEPEVADAREQAVQLRLVDDFAGELGGAATRHERQAVERTGNPLAEPPAYRDPNPQGRCHGPRIGPGCVRPHHADAVSPRATRAGGRVELQSAMGGVSPSRGESWRGLRALKMRLGVSVRPMR